MATSPVLYVVNASDLKYADDTYVIIPAVNKYSRCGELDHIQRWAETNNLTLNCHKSTETTVTLSHHSK